MSRFEVAPLAIFDTIVRHPLPNGYTIPREGRLFASIPGVLGDFSNAEFPGLVASDQSITIKRLVLEARAAKQTDLGVLRTDIQLRLMIGSQERPLLSPLFDKITPDGVATYDYFTDPFHIYDEELELRAEAQKRANAGDESTARWLKELGDLKPAYAYVPARQSVEVKWNMTARAQDILHHPESMARVWIQGFRQRDVA